MPDKSHRRWNEPPQFIPELEKDTPRAAQSYVPPNSGSIDLTKSALRDSLTDGSFIDTTFYAFSKKSSTGTVHTPCAVYASSAVLKKASMYFDRCESFVCGLDEITIAGGAHSAWFCQCWQVVSRRTARPALTMFLHRG